jgi:hypothetical protein
MSDSAQSVARTRYMQAVAGSSSIWHHTHQIWKTIYWLKQQACGRAVCKARAAAAHPAASASSAPPYSRWLHAVNSRTSRSFSSRVTTDCSSPMCQGQTPDCCRRLRTPCATWACWLRHTIVTCSANDLRVSCASYMENPSCTHSVCSSFCECHLAVLLGVVDLGARRLQYPGVALQQLHNCGG